ncbi:MAG: serine protease [Deltaproteobacteria bacterium]|nr:serine protease [Deltaproteobacteria bacterium]
MISNAFIRLLFVAAIVVMVGCSASAVTRKDALADLSQHVGNLERRMEAVEARQRNMVDLLARTRGAVAFIWGTYTFVDKDGRPLRQVVSELGEPVADPQGIPLVDVKGTGPIAFTNYCGTAFLVGPKGEMLTNRHIAEPWWEDDQSAPLLAAGLKPVFLRLRAFFQERSAGVPIEVLRIDEKQDIALVRTVSWTPAAQPLSLHPHPDKSEEGQPILLIGYPTGLEAVMAKLDEGEQAVLEEQTGDCTYKTAERLSEQKRLRASITSGFLWDVLPHLLVYDARTIGGGSGGPLLDWSGTVIGVNSAYLEEFLGGNYGVPIRFGKLLLAGGGKPIHEARAESQELLALYEMEKGK